MADLGYGMALGYSGPWLWRNGT